MPVSRIIFRDVVPILTIIALLNLAGCGPNILQCCDAFTTSTWFQRQSMCHGGIASSSSRVTIHSTPSADINIPKSELDRKRLLSSLTEWIAKAPKNGIDTPPDLATTIEEICQQLEEMTPNPSPTQIPSLLNGFWYMMWTNYSPAGPSSGKLGPFIGNVYQDLQLDDYAIARNIFRLDFPLPIMGELTATPSIRDDTTIAIAFVKVGTKLAGFLPFGPNIEFEQNKEIRLWDHIYVDDDYRILYAKNAASDANSVSSSDGLSNSIKDRGFLYVMKRADGDRFSTNI
ncbi:plastid lipid-associated PAP/fibrillin family protein [Nitzschia inconspicua]|uniref:Plastid lipid-associated PAP/fibrillin family protein n=1 Tax=Nitzschia inconspicua TaxID=303405 RepID=A0A9K3L7E2_9STRA|nr:plastid lipid-associated PAP/fibrillin family protein [Nitzschia inconspicua]